MTIPTEPIGSIPRPLELIEAIERVAPDEIYCTHGPRDFADRLRERGFNARPLAGNTQLRLF